MLFFSHMNLSWEKALIPTVYHDCQFAIQLICSLGVYVLVWSIFVLFANILKKKELSCQGEYLRLRWCDFRSGRLWANGIVEMGCVGGWRAKLGSDSPDGLVTLKVTELLCICRPVPPRDRSSSYIIIYFYKLLPSPSSLYSSINPFSSSLCHFRSRSAISQRTNPKNLID